MSLHVVAKRKWKGFALDMEFTSQGGTLGILGASGCGKSMTLKCIAGIETPDSGKITIGEQVLYDSSQGVNLRPQDRKIGYLFQNYALFPHMKVEENIACALGKVPKAQRQQTVEEMLRRFRLEGLGGRFPGQLSGGQQQRVALARILAYEPNALLLDEPFSALDFYLKEQLQLELKDMLEEYSGDVVIVTHSRDEVYQLCEQLMVMEDGRCIASGKTRELFRNPGLLSVARLTGCKNFSAAKPLGKYRILAKDWGIELATSRPVDQDIDCIGVRAHDFMPATEGDGENTFSVQLRERLESPFEWNMLFSPGPEAASVWWKISKESYGGNLPDFLRVDPDNILLLRSGGPAIRKDACQ